ncbi:MAG TPA: hypothetical protein ENN61_02970 [Bacteroidaceae bacterium]|nr:hypothetical protein [Bacteroidaceae bacterium]
MTIEDGVGTMVHSLSSIHTADLWEDAIIEISYVVSGVTCKAVFLFDVVLNKLEASVTDDDLKEYFPLLATEIWSGTSNYDDQIQEAFRMIKRDIKNKGKRPAMLIDGMQVRELVIFKTFEIIFFSFAKNEDSIWWTRYLEMKEKYKTAFEALRIKYDEDESGTIDSDEDETLGQVTLVR